MNVSKEGSGDLHSGTALAGRFRKQVFDTVSGTVEMDEDGDKISQYSVLSFDAHTSHFREAFVYEPLRRELNRVRGWRIAWPAGRPPLDVPLCGFMHENLACQIGEQNEAEPKSNLNQIGTGLFNVHFSTSFFQFLIKPSF